MRHFFLIVLFFCSFFKSLPSYELSIAAIFRNEAPYFKEWIEYHRMVGVEHFWLYNDTSQDNWLEVLQPYISEGVVEIIDWPVPDFLQFIHYQVYAYRDALKRAKGQTTWLALIDIDEFLLPKDEATVTDCLKVHFADAAAIYVNWRHFGTNGVYLKEYEPLLFRLTACNNKLHSTNGVGKTIVRPDCTNAEDLWNPHHCVLEAPNAYYDGDGKYIGSGYEPALDGKGHTNVLQLNHYKMRDENYFRNVRLTRPGIEEWLLWEHYNAFNLEQDTTIIDFIMLKHPMMFEKFWKPFTLNPTETQ